MKDQLLKKLLDSPKLPSLPTIAIEIIDLVQQEDVNINQIAETIQFDPALTSKILKTVNSSFYGQSYSISTISHAIVVLGLNAVKTLALGFSLVSKLKDSSDEGFNHLDFWQRSLYTATAAKTIANKAKLDMAEEAFLGGLMQDLGMLVMGQVLETEYDQILISAKDDHRKLARIESRELDCTHAEVGAELAKKWGLPATLVGPILYHSNVEEADEDIQPLVRCIALGNEAADIYMGQNPGIALDNFYRHSRMWFGIEKEDAIEILKGIHDTSGDMKSLFELPTGELGDPDALMAKANEAMMNISLKASKENEELKTKNEQLVQESQTDSLTGAANRRKFNDFISSAFEQAKQLNEPLSVLFFDADHFKNFNDSHGHATGDRVLIEISSLLQKLTPENGLVARYGGEEFSVVLPNCTRKEAATIAEKMRSTLETTPVDSEDGQPLTVTASIGVACYEGTFFNSAEHLLKAADQGVYAAKAAGRNCVRVFAAKQRTSNVASAA